MTYAAETVLDAVIVGGGPTGVAAFCAMVRRSAVSSVAVVDPIPIGLGNVFGERCAADPMLLCNSSNGLTWIDAGRHNDFVDFLVGQGWPVASEDHVPRYLIGEYCRHRYVDARRRARESGISVHEYACRVRSVKRRGAHYEVALDDGRSLVARNVLLCTGLEVPKIPPMLQPYADHPRYLSGAYPASALRELPAGANVLLLGLRSSAQDAMLVLVRSGHRVTMTSPSGRVSSIRDVFRDPGRQHLDRAAIEALDPADPALFGKVFAILRSAAESAGAGLELESQISSERDGQRRLRDDLALAEAGQTRWADLIFETVNAINAVAGAWDAATRQRILPAAYEFTSRFIASLPLLSGQRLVEELDRGSVTLSPVFLRTLAPDEAGWTAVWADGREERFDYVVSTSGYHFPRFAVTSEGEIAVTHAGAISPDGKLAQIGPDLRLSVDAGPERIWALGAATNARFPFAHLLWLAAQHADEVARQVAVVGDSRWQGGRTPAAAEVA